MDERSVTGGWHRWPDSEYHAESGRCEDFRASRAIKKES